MPKASVKNRSLPKKVKGRSSTAQQKKALPPMPSYFGFSKGVVDMFVVNKGIFSRLLFTGVFILLLIIGPSQYSHYADLTTSTEEVSGQLEGNIQKVAVEVFALMVTVMSGSLTSGISETQQVYSGLFYLLLWLVTIWLIRHIVSGASVKFRDGLYSAGAPILSTIVVITYGLIQLLPLAILIWVLSVMSATGAVGGVLFTVLGTFIAVAFAGLTLYWLIGTLFASIIVTLPNTYPLAALRSAKQLVGGIRLRLLKRILWLLLLVTVAHLLVLLPVITFDALLGYPFPWIITLVTTLLSVGVVIYGAGYMYLLYRRVIDERA